MSKFKKIGLAVAGAVVLFGGCSILMGEEEVDKPTAPKTEEVSQETPAKTEEVVVEEEAKPSITSIGEELKVGDVVFKVTGVTTSNKIGNDFLAVNSQGTFLVVDVEVRNEGAEALTVDSSFFTLSANGKTYESDSEAGIYANESADFFLTGINPDLTLAGKVVFDVSDAVLEAEQVINVQTGFWGTETGEIKIK